jgi:hypothetical protein
VRSEANIRYNGGRIMRYENVSPLFYILAYGGGESNRRIKSNRPPHSVEWLEN